jgi:Zn-finger nucleic acid-binding protein
MSSLKALCADTAQQAAVLNMPLHTADAQQPVQDTGSISCPVCGMTMARIDFAHVAVDVCKADGVWFDRDELRRIVEGVRAGGTGNFPIGQLGGGNVDLLSHAHQLAQTGHPQLASMLQSASSGGSIFTASNCVSGLLHVAGFILTSILED